MCEWSHAEPIHQRAFLEQVPVGLLGGQNGPTNFGCIEFECNYLAAGWETRMKSEVLDGTADIRTIGIRYSVYISYVIENLGSCMRGQMVSGTESSSR